MFVAFTQILTSVKKKLLLLGIGKNDLVEDGF